MEAASHCGLNRRQELSLFSKLLVVSLVFDKAASVCSVRFVLSDALHTDMVELILAAATGEHSFK